MANARIHDYTLAIDPTSASWGYSLNVKSFDTYGGRVIQTLSCKIESLTIGGYLPMPDFRRDANGNVIEEDAGKSIIDIRYDNMIAFEKAVKSIMDYQSATKSPVIFDYPALDWYAWVYLMGYKDVKYDVATSAVSFSLTFEVENGFESLVKTAESYGLDLINSGVEWVRNEFNTPSKTWEDLRAAYEALLNDAGTLELMDSLFDYLDAKDASGADGASAAGGGVFVPGGQASSDSGAGAVQAIGSKVNERSQFARMLNLRTSSGGGGAHTMRTEVK